jgi:hypothetical protein
MLAAKSLLRRWWRRDRPAVRDRLGGGARGRGCARGRCCKRDEARDVRPHCGCLEIDTVGNMIVVRSLVRESARLFPAWDRSVAASEARRARQLAFCAVAVAVASGPRSFARQRCLRSRAASVWAPPRLRGPPPLLRRAAATTVAFDGFGGGSIFTPSTCVASLYARRWRHSRARYHKRWRRCWHRVCRRHCRRRGRRRNQYNCHNARDPSHPPHPPPPPPARCNRCVGDDVAAARVAPALPKRAPPVRRRRRTWAPPSAGEGCGELGVASAAAESAANQSIGRDAAARRRFVDRPSSRRSRRCATLPCRGRVQRCGGKRKRALRLRESN